MEFSGTISVVFPKTNLHKLLLDNVYSTKNKSTLQRLLVLIPNELFPSSGVSLRDPITVRGTLTYDDKIGLNVLDASIDNDKKNFTRYNGQVLVEK
jgi:hypothetical protein